MTPARALLGEHADDLEARRAELDRLAERVLAGREQVAEHRLADERDAAAVRDVRPRDRAARRERVVLGRRGRPASCRSPTSSSSRPRRSPSRVVETTGETDATSGAWLGSSIALTDCCVSDARLGLRARRRGPRPKRPRLSTVIVFVPSALIRLCTACEEPVPTASRMITAATPISTPSTVSAERSLFALIAAPGDPEGVEHVHATAPADASTARRSEPRRRRRHRDAATVVDDQAVAQPHHALGVRGDVLLVRDQDDRPAAGVEAAEHVHDLVARRVSRLPVGSSARTSAGLGHDRARERDPLLLAARELVREVVAAVGEPDRSSASAARARRSSRLDARVEQRQLDVRERGRPRDQVERLEDEADLAVADPRQRRLVERPHVDRRRGRTGPASGRRGSR